jgi:hypothetical protein
MEITRMANEAKLKKRELTKEMSAEQTWQNRASSPRPKQPGPGPMLKSLRVMIEARLPMRRWPWPTG